MLCYNTAHMGSPRGVKQDQKREVFRLALIGLIGQVGCITLVIVLLVTLGGLWLDRQLGTRPLFTLILVFGSIPVSILIMLFLVRKGVDRVRGQLEESGERVAEEDVVGRD